MRWMVKVKDLDEWYLLPAWLRSECRAAAQSTLDQQGDPLESVAEVTSIVYDAAGSHVSMAVRITPAPKTVKLDIEVTCPSKK